MAGSTRTVCRTALKQLAGLLAAGLFAALTAAPAAAKTPGKSYCFNGICHTVQTLKETRRQIGRTSVLKTSFYDACGRDKFNPCGLTSSGEEFRPWRADNAASPIYPNGTKLLVWHPKTRKTLVVRVNNAGPYWGDRKLDLSRTAAEKLGISGSGVASVHVRVLEAPSKAEATYKRGRTYSPVPGYVGVFADIDRAFADFGKAIASIFVPSSAQAATAPGRTVIAARAPAARTWGQRSSLGGPQSRPVAPKAAIPVRSAALRTRRPDSRPDTTSALR